MRTDYYSQTKIYKVYNEKDIFIGATVNPTLALRLAQHKMACKKYYNDPIEYIYSPVFGIINSGNYKIELIEKLNLESKDELNQALENARQKII